MLASLHLCPASLSLPGNVLRCSSPPAFLSLSPHHFFRIDVWKPATGSNLAADKAGQDYSYSLVYSHLRLSFCQARPIPLPCSLHFRGAAKDNQTQHSIPITEEKNASFFFWNYSLVHTLSWMCVPVSFFQIASLGLGLQSCFER